MHLTVRLFALQRQQLGRRSLDLEVAAGSTIEAAWEALAAAYPVLGPARSSMRFARNGVYAEPTEVLAEGDELALLPPVAGGADEDGAERTGMTAGWPRIELSEDPIDDGVLTQLRAGLAGDADGALVEFVGRTRITPGTPAPGQEDEAARHAGEEVQGLDYEAYEAMAVDVLQAIGAEIEARWGLRRLAIRHRLGPVGVGEASVAILVAAPHRAAAFEACRYAIDELKARAPIWKSERFADGSVWLGAPPRHGPRDP
ncbi:MAG TPA: molybdenum cofactor biosynthesis protein MoaE [Candidatus Limnocylindrales bacterium]|nr:molybdenum cofactor biosynthesis protein MoaE [Candidatus Limnocylindrales bacterium]